jgi:hypothetical protein
MKIFDLTFWLIFFPGLICVGLIILRKTIAFRYNNNNNNSSTRNAGFGKCVLNLLIILTILILKVTWWSLDCWLGPPGHQARWLNCSNSWLHHRHWWISYIELETLKDRYHPTTPCIVMQGVQRYRTCILCRITNNWDTNSLRLMLPNCVIVWK